MKFRSLAAALALAALLPLSAIAQSQATLNTPAVKPTFSAVVTGLVPAASATDFLTLTGSATKTIRVTRAQCTGTSTAAGTNTIVLLTRSTANSAGTSSAVAAAKHDSGTAAATATALSYTANPTTGTLAGNLRSASFTTGTSTAMSQNLIFTFGDERLNTPVTLRGTSQVFALNGAGASFPSGTALNCNLGWEEEP